MNSQVGTHLHTALSQILISQTDASYGPCLDILEKAASVAEQSS